MVLKRRQHGFDLVQRCIGLAQPDRPSLARQDRRHPIRDPGNQGIGWCGHLHKRLQRLLAMAPRFADHGDRNRLTVMWTDHPLLGLTARQLLAFIEGVRHQDAASMRNGLREGRPCVDGFAARVHVLRSRRCRVVFASEAPPHRDHLTFTLSIQPHDVGQAHWCGDDNLILDH